MMKQLILNSLVVSTALLMGCKEPLEGTAERAQASSTPTATSGSRFTLFESGQVRPLALSGDGDRLFAVNTPDNRLEVFETGGAHLRRRFSVPVGLEPVAVAVRSRDEVWVVNHLSDSVSVVRLDDESKTGRVVRTLLVGDEPRDIVFAGPGRKRAFITTAHRGQNNPADPQLTTPGVGRADVWVFDADNLGASLGGNPLSVVTLFADTPRALAVTPDGKRVYAAAFHSGNRTATVFDQLVAQNGGLPPPLTNFEGAPAPVVGLIVKHNGTHWTDELGRTWDAQINFTLPDKDVFVIDAMATPPAPVQGAAGYYSGVGTVLFNMIVNPVSGKVYVSNTEALNQNRFEGPGTFAGHSVRGHLHESRITVLGSTGVTPRHLNKHINYNACCAAVPNAESVRSLASPQGMAITRDGRSLYVAAMGSSKVGVFSTEQLENDTFVPDLGKQIQVSGGGPTGLALDEPRSRLYVMTRFDNSVSIIDTRAGAEVGHVSMHNPEPARIVAGRRFLYDAAFSSSHGDSSCASCHIFGDFDSLAWDLGNPDAPVVNNANPFLGIPLIPQVFASMKGPMVTQSLRGMANHGPMHWRGDRTGSADAANAQPGSGAFDEKAGFKKFQGGFTELLGRSAPIPDEAMDSFADFILDVTYPPNPIRNLDNSLTPDQAAGRAIYLDNNQAQIAIHQLGCNQCHVLDPQGNAQFGVDHPGFFGSDGHSSFSFTAQHVKVPHLRNMYQKVGMFGLPHIPFNDPFQFFGFVINPGDNDFKGDQVRGFGFTHDGSFDTIFRFLSTIAFDQAPFNPNAIPRTPEGDVQRRQLEAFQLAFDSNLAPIVGQQITLTRDNAAVAGPRVDLLVARADAGECDLVAKGVLAGREQGFLYLGDGRFQANRQIFPPLNGGQLRFLSTGPLHVEMTYTCTPPGSGRRVGIDRDEDGFLDGDEEVAGSDPENPASKPW